jgi:hypothetical protein
MADSVTKQPRWCIAPYFIVDDVVTTANYYRDKLGFEYERFWGEPPCFCMVQRSSIVIMLKQLEVTGVMRPNRTVDPERGAWDAYIWIDNADASLRGVQFQGRNHRAGYLRPTLWLSRLRRGRLQRLPAVFWAKPRRMRGQRAGHR